jgi:hypothetical protein
MVKMTGPNDITDRRRSTVMFSAMLFYLQLVCSSTLHFRVSLDSWNTEYEPVSIYIYIYICLCVCVCVYIYIYIHTHIYIYRRDTTPKLVNNATLQRTMYYANANRNTDYKICKTLPECTFYFVRHKSHIGILVTSLETSGHICVFVTSLETSGHISVPVTIFETSGHILTFYFVRNKRPHLCTCYAL